MLSKPNIWHSRYILYFFTLIGLSTMLISACDSQSANIQVPCNRIDLITAINDANQNPDLSILVLETNCIYEFTGPDNRDGGVGLKALPIITSPIKIIGNNASLLRIDGPKQFRFFEITSAGSLRLEDITLENGYGVGSESDPRGGGAIVNEGGVLTLHNVILKGNRGLFGGAVYSNGSLIIEENTFFDGNTSTQRGGAIYIDGTAGIPISISDTTISGSRVGFWEGYGGAIYIAGTDGAGTGILGSIIENNYSKNNGGGIYFADPEGALHITNSSFVSNKAAEDGGAIYAEDGEMFITGSSFTGNSVFEDPKLFHSEQQGGAIYVKNGTHLIRNCLFEYNMAEGEGGSLLNEDGAITIEQSSFYEGNAVMTLEGKGGAIFNYNDLDITNSNFVLCGATSGGALYNTGNASLTNVTMRNNQGWDHGGHITNSGNLNMSFVTLYEGITYEGGNSVYSSGTINVKDSIFENTRPGSNCSNQGGSFIATGENIDFGGNCPGFSIHADPLIIDDGQGTGLFLLDTNSPAFDNASNCLDLNNDPVITDQRGTSRPQPSPNGACDIGAVEMEQIPGPPPEQPQALPRLSAPENLTCREGDNNDYPAAGYLLEGEIAEVIGRNSESTWLVINNPDWEGICWLYRGSVNLEGDPDNTKVYTSPPLVLEPDDSNGDSSDSGPVCRSDMQAEECKKAGGTYYTQSLPYYCKCP